jgi:DNA-binding LytR/AlgR family response regulator
LGDLLIYGIFEEIDDGVLRQQIEVGLLKIYHVKQQNHLKDDGFEKLWVHHVYIYMYMGGRKGIDIASRCTTKEARTSIIYVYIHGRLDVMSVYVLSKVTRLRTEPVPVDPNEIRTRVKQTRKLRQRGLCTREIRVYVF